HQPRDPSARIAHREPPSTGPKRHVQADLGHIDPNHSQPLPAPPSASPPRSPHSPALHDSGFAPRQPFGLVIQGLAATIRSSSHAVLIRPGRRAICRSKLLFCFRYLAAATTNAKLARDLFDHAYARSAATASSHTLAATIRSSSHSISSGPQPPTICHSHS